MPENIITIQNFSKRFGDNEVISNLSFNVHDGEVFALLGANGSGKTTAIRCLLGILEPTKGTLRIKGKQYGPEMSEMVGYLPEERGLYVSESVIDTMVYLGELKGLSKELARTWSYEYLERVGLPDKAKMKIKKLSSGQQQKIQLGITIINDPKLLVLDEPTSGLDPMNRTLLMDILLDLKQKGSTIIFITHQMEEVEKIADRLLMIKDGKRELYGNVTEVKSNFGENRINVDFQGAFPVNKALYQASINTNTAVLVPNEDISSDEILRYLSGQDISIKKYEVALPSLHEIFIKISKKDGE